MCFIGSQEQSLFQFPPSDYSRNRCTFNTVVTRFAGLDHYDQWCSTHYNGGSYLYPTP